QREDPIELSHLNGNREIGNLAMGNSGGAWIAVKAAARNTGRVQGGDIRARTGAKIGHALVGEEFAQGRRQLPIEPMAVICQPVTAFAYRLFRSCWSSLASIRG